MIMQLSLRYSIATHPHACYYRSTQTEFRRQTAQLRGLAISAENFSFHWLNISVDVFSDITKITNKQRRNQQGMRILYSHYRL